MTRQNERPECSLIGERLAALLEDGLPAGEAALVRAHLTACDDCSIELAATRRLVAGLRDDRVDDATFATATARLAAALDAETAAKKPTLVARIPLALRVAAVLAICAGALSFAPPPSIAFDSVARATDAAFRGMNATLPHIGSLVPSPNGDRR